MKSCVLTFYRQEKLHVKYRNVCQFNAFELLEKNRFQSKVQINDLHFSNQFKKKTYEHSSITLKNK